MCIRDRAVEAHPDLDYTKAASMVLMDGLMQRVSTAEEMCIRDRYDSNPNDLESKLTDFLTRQTGEAVDLTTPLAESEGKTWQLSLIHIWVIVSTSPFRRCGETGYLRNAG